MARRATSLGHKPYLLYIFLFRATSLGPKPSLSFFSLLLIEKTVVPLNKGIFVYFRVFPFVCPQPFLASHLLIFFVSLLLFLFLFFVFFLFFFVFFFFSLFFFHERNNIQKFNYKMRLHQSFFFWGGGGGPVFFFFPFLSLFFFS